MSTNHPPSELWLGMKDGEWPVHTFINENQAIYWLRDSETAPRKRRVWKVDVVNATELTLVAPEPYLAPADPQEAAEYHDAGLELAPVDERAETEAERTQHGADSRYLHSDGGDA